MSDIDDTEQLYDERLEEEAVTLTELRDHLRSFVTQLDEAPSEPVVLPWMADRGDSPEEEGRSPSSHRAQTPALESAAFATGTGFTEASKEHCNLHTTKMWVKSCIVPEWHKYIWALQTPATLRCWSTYACPYALQEVVSFQHTRHKICSKAAAFVHMEKSSPQPLLVLALY